jgi:outer membrane receptor protein involved in Fe transport
MRLTVPLLTFTGLLVGEHSVAANTDWTDAAPQPRVSADAPVNAAGAARNADNELSEVIVSAQRKVERLQDVPIPVTAMAGAALADSNHFRLQDYASQVPGLTAASSDTATGPVINIRGIAPAGFGNPTVGIMVDDVPFGSEIAFGGGFVAPELDPSDLQRVEVLRGPQGTLYGAASMGGLLKYVTVDPSTDAVSGRIQAGASLVHSGPKPGYNFSAGLNLPVSDTVAVRVSGFARRDPGYIENVQDGERGVNEAKLGGIHLSGLWRPSADFSLKLSALLQRNQAFGMSYVTAGLGDLQQSFLPHTGLLDRNFAAYNATLNAKLGIFDIISVTGYNINKLALAIDSTPIVGPMTSLAFPTPYTYEQDGFNARKLTQEIRLTTRLWNRVDWLLGGFYTHENTPTYTTYHAAQEDGALYGFFGHFSNVSIYSEWAAFTDITWHLTERWDVQIGGRESQMRQGYTEVDAGPYVPLIEQVPSPNVYPQGHAYENAFTYLLTPRFKLSDNLMVYARMASGFRPGGINQGTISAGLPAQFKPDKTFNYEIGVKGNMLDHRLSFDGSVYYIDWQDIQVSIVNPLNPISYYSNAGRAKSQGLELSVQALPVQGLKLGTSLSLNDAKLTDPMPANSVVYGRVGARLAYSVRFSANATIDYSFPLPGASTGSVGGMISYVGSRLGAFLPTPDRQYFPAYATTDLHAEVDHGPWTADLFVNNVTDRRGLLGGGAGTYWSDSFNVITPRTVALSIARTF